MVDGDSITMKPIFTVVARHASSLSRRFTIPTSVRTVVVGKRNLIGALEVQELAAMVI